MAVNSVGDFIKSVFSPMIDRSGVVFRSLFADTDETGTVEICFKEFEETRKTWEVKGANLYLQQGEQLRKSLDVFSVLERLNSDTDETILKRFALLFQRNGDIVWGDKWDILKIFKSLFGTQKVWIVNNTDKFSGNLIVNGDFENETGWNLDGAEYDKNAGFEGVKGMLLDASGQFFQTVPVENNSSYFLHFFLKGNVNVCIESEGKYWNPHGGEFGSWVNNEFLIPFESQEWDSHSLFFLTDETKNSVKITFRYESGKMAYVDYVMMNKKSKSSTFSLIALFDGKATNETALYAPGTNDPIKAFNYDKMGYFSPGKSDVTERNDEALSYYDKSAITEDVHPVMDSVKEDIAQIEGYENMTYLDGETPVLSPESPTGKEGHVTVDYDKQSYFDKTYIFGAGGSEKQKNLYQDILDIVQPAGVISTIELLTRESDE